MGSRATLQEKTKSALALAPVDYTTTVNGLAVDRKGFNDVLFQIPLGVLNADTSITITLEESDASGSGFAAVSGFSVAVTGADDATVKEMFVDARGRKRYLRLVFTGSSTSALIGATAVMEAAHVLPAA